MAGGILSPGHWRGIELEFWDIPEFPESKRHGKVSKPTGRPLPFANGQRSFEVRLPTADECLAKRDISLENEK